MQPHLEDWSEQGFDVLLVAADEAGVRAFLGENDIDFPVLLDPKMALFRAYGVSAIPHSVTVDRDGVVRYTDIGWGPGSLEKVRSRAEELCPQ